MDYSFDNGASWQRVETIEALMQSSQKTDATYDKPLPFSVLEISPRETVRVSLKIVLPSSAYSRYGRKTVRPGACITFKLTVSESMGQSSSSMFSYIAPPLPTLPNKQLTDLFFLYIDDDRSFTRFSVTIIRAPTIPPVTDVTRSYNTTRSLFRVMSRENMNMVGDVTVTVAMVRHWVVSAHSEWLKHSQPTPTVEIHDISKNIYIESSKDNISHDGGQSAIIPGEAVVPSDYEWEIKSLSSSYFSAVYGIFDFRAEARSSSVQGVMWGLKVRLQVDVNNENGGSSDNADSRPRWSESVWVIPRVLYTGQTLSNQRSVADGTVNGTGAVSSLLLKRTAVNADEL